MHWPYSICYAMQRRAGSVRYEYSFVSFRGDRDIGRHLLPRSARYRPNGASLMRAVEYFC